MTSRTAAATPVTRWTVFSLSYLMMVLFGLTLQSLAPMATSISAEIRLTHAQTALLIGAYGLPGFFMPILASRLSRRFNGKHMAIFGLATAGAGAAAFCFSGTYHLLLVSRFVSGMGAMVLLAMAPVFVNNIFGRGSIGKVIGLFNTGVPLGFVLAVNIFGRASAVLGWRAASAIPAVLSAGILVLFICLFRREWGSIGGRETRNGSAGIWPLVLPMAAVNLLMNAGSAPFSAFAPEYLRISGLTEAQAGTFLTVMMAETALLGPLAGILADRIGRYRLLIGVAGISIASSFVLMLQPGLSMLAGGLLLGAATAIVPVAMFPLLSDVVGPSALAAGLGILMTASNIGTNVGLGLFGAVVDTGGFTPGLLLLAACGLLIVPAVWSVRKREEPVEALRVRGPVGA